MKKLSIILPAYNEGKTIHLILDKVKDSVPINEIVKEIIVVNDCSADDTENAFTHYMNSNPYLNITCLKYKTNRGKGAALRTGIQDAAGDYLIIQDAGLEYDSNQYNILLQPIVDGFTDVMYGSRFMGGNPHRILFSGIQQAISS